MTSKLQLVAVAAACGLLGMTQQVFGKEMAAAFMTASDADTSAVVYPHVTTMVAEAVNLERPGHYLEAADLYEASASIVAFNDPDALTYLNRAGLLSYHAGELERARRLFEEVGSRATDLGDYEVASLAYERAMHIAYEQGDLQQAADYYMKSLTDKERDALLRRVSRNREISEAAHLP